MTHTIKKDKKRRHAYSQSFSYLLYLKYLGENLPRHDFVTKLSSIGKKSSLTRVQNRCISTGRARGVFRCCRLSRIRFRELASQGLLAGIVKSSW